MNTNEDSTTGQLSKLIDSTEELLRRTAAFGSAEVEAGRDRLKRQWDAASEQAADWRDSAGAGLKRVGRAADDCAHRHTWPSIAVAGLAGAMIAACLLSSSGKR